jgi:hypothetical protein
MRGSPPAEEVEEAEFDEQGEIAYEGYDKDL